MKHSPPNPFEFIEHLLSHDVACVSPAAKIWGSRAAARATATFAIPDFVLSVGLGQEVVA